MTSYKVLNYEQLIVLAEQNRSLGTARSRKVFRSVGKELNRRQKELILAKRRFDGK